MSILLPPPKNPSLPLLRTPLWVPGPEQPLLLPGQVHIWRVRMEEPVWSDGACCPVSRGRSGNLRNAIFRQDILDRYAGAASGLPRLQIAVAQCEHLALIALSRAARGMGLDLERVSEDLPFEEMAGGFLDARSQWDLRITLSPQEKAWKFFRFWTSNEACAQARPSSRFIRPCHVRGFSPDTDFIAALAIEGGLEAEVRFWDWQC